MVHELSRLMAEVRAVGDGLMARVVTLEEHRTRVEQLEAQGLAREWLWEAEDLEAFVAANDLLDSIIDAGASFRSRFTDTEWKLYEAGKCSWQTLRPAQHAPPAVPLLPRPRPRAAPAGG
jgi:hypothetical protein